MGRRKKAAKKVVKKRRIDVPTEFKCIFCSTEGSVTVHMDHNTNLGKIDR